MVSEVVSVVVDNSVVSGSFETAVVVFFVFFVFLVIVVVTISVEAAVAFSVVVSAVVITVLSGVAAAGAAVVVVVVVSAAVVVVAAVVVLADVSVLVLVAVVVVSAKVAVVVAAVEFSAVFSTISGLFAEQPHERIAQKARKNTLIRFTSHILQNCSHKFKRRFVLFRRDFKADFSREIKIYPPIKVRI